MTRRVDPDTHDRKPMIGGDEWPAHDNATYSGKRCGVTLDVWGCGQRTLVCAGRELHVGDFHYDAFFGVFWEAHVVRSEYEASKRRYQGALYDAPAEVKAGFAAREKQAWRGMTVTVGAARQVAAATKPTDPDERDLDADFARMNEEAYVPPWPTRANGETL